MRCTKTLVLLQINTTRKIIKHSRDIFEIIRV